MARRDDILRNPYLVAIKSSISQDSLTWTSLPSDLEEKIVDVTGPIQQKANRIRSQTPVQWFPYYDSDLISENDYNFLIGYQAAITKESRDQLLDYLKDDAFNSMVCTVQTVCVIEDIQKFLVLVHDMLCEDESRVELLCKKNFEPWRSFLDLLMCTDNFVRNISSRIIAKLIKMGKPNIFDLTFYTNWLKDELKPDNRYLNSVARCLQELLKVDEYRLLFMATNGIFKIVRMLTTDIKPQAQYQLVFCLWVASFNPKVAEELNRFKTIEVLMDLLESTTAEITKLPRIILYTFCNLLEKPADEAVRRQNALAMVQRELLKYMEVAEKRISSYDDPEHLEVFKVVEKVLSKHLADMSTFEQYYLEVKSGHLEWSVAHKSQTFWKENAERLNENNYELLKILLRLLDYSDDVEVLCIASHDLGQYMTNYPRGKKVLEELGGKELLLQCLSFRQPEVRYYALRSLQIMMLRQHDLLLQDVNDKKHKRLDVM